MLFAEVVLELVLVVAFVGVEVGFEQDVYPVDDVVVGEG